MVSIVEGANTTGSPSSVRDADQRVYLHGVSWAQYEALLAMRGESSAVRITYLRGEVELMAPSRGHEKTKTFLGRLLEAWAEETGVDLNGYESWTIKESEEKRGAEPDECGVLRFFVLEGERYQQAERSRILPSFDPEPVLPYLAEPNQTRAVRAFRAALRGE